MEEKKMLESLLLFTHHLLFIFVFCVDVSFIFSNWWKNMHTLRLIKNRVLKGVFGPKREEGVGFWRKL
jgi:hypothetical protein